MALSADSRCLNVEKNVNVSLRLVNNTVSLIHVVLFVKVFLFFVVVVLIKRF